MTTHEFVQHAKSLAWLWRHLTSIAAILGTIWFGAGYIVKPKAQEVLDKMLIENPVFKKMQTQLETQTQAIEEIQAQQKKTETTLNGVADETGDTGDAVKKLDGKFDDLVNILINRPRTDLAAPIIPPVQP